MSRPTGTATETVALVHADTPVFTICPQPHALNFSSLPLKEETMLNSSFIDMFGHIVLNITKDQVVHELFEAAMLNGSEVVEDISGFSQNKEKSGSNVLAPVMPLNTYG